MIDEIGQKHYEMYGRDTTDKFIHHHYTLFYDEYLKNEHFKSILEIGVKDGASLLLWQDSFPDAKIYGIDIKDVSRKKLVVENKLWKIFQGDQADEDFLEKVVEYGQFDLIIDDACHEPCKQVASLNYLWPHLSKNGWYVIEDIPGSDLKGDEPYKTIVSLCPTAKVRRSKVGRYNICFMQKT